MKIIIFCLVISASSFIPSFANVLTTDTHRRWGANSHILHIPLYLKEQEDTEKRHNGQNTKEHHKQATKKHTPSITRKRRNQHRRKEETIKRTKYPLLHL